MASHLVYSSTLCLVFIQSKYYLVTHSLIQSITHSINYSFNQSLIQSITHLINHSFNQSIIQSITHTINHSFNQSLIQSITHSINRSFTHSLTHLLTHPLTCSPFVSFKPSVCSLLYVYLKDNAENDSKRENLFILLKIT